MKKERKKNIYLYIALLVFVLIGMYNLNKYSSANTETRKEIILRDLDEIKSSKQITIARALFDEGINSSKENEKTHNKFIKIADSLGVELRIDFEDNAKRLLEKLSNNEIDIIASKIPKSIDIDSSKYQYLAMQNIKPIYLVQRKDSISMLSRQIDLAKKTITLPLGSEYAVFIKDLSEYIGEDIHIKYDSTYNYQQLAVLVSSGKIDYTVISEAEKNILKEHIDNIDMSIALSFHSRAAWLIRKDSKKLYEYLSKLGY